MKCINCNSNITRKYIAAVISLGALLVILRGIGEFFIAQRGENSSEKKNDELFFFRGLKHRNPFMESEFHTAMPRYLNDAAIHVMFIYFQTPHHGGELQKNMQRCLSSLLKHATGPYLTVHMFGDHESFVSFKAIFDQIASRSKPSNTLVVYHDLTKFPETMKMMKDINDRVSKVRHSFSHPYFYLSLFMHKLLPQTISRLIILDADLVIKSDITKLYNHFENFTNANIIGLARENQPTYRYMFYEFRLANPNTRVGEPPPHGLTGFNSGVVLLDLAKMRKSAEYNALLSSVNLANVSRKYKFQGNLGDQDVFTLMSMENEHLFYVLPCGWNRQLCRWWQRADFEQVFSSYFSCKEKIHILHGNCHSLNKGVRKL